MCVVELKREGSRRRARRLVEEQDGPGSARTHEMALMGAEMDFNDYSDVEYDPDNAADVGEEALALAPSVWVGTSARWTVWKGRAARGRTRRAPQVIARAKLRTTSAHDVRLVLTIIARGSRPQGLTPRAG